MKGSGIQMKKNLEEMQVKVANKRAILESHDGEEFSPITVAKNVLCEDGTTMQDYFDSHSEPNISTKIVNSNSMSKVGQGDSVDFSDNVMNGAYEDVVLKGKSLVNVLSYTKVGGNVPLVKNGNIIEVETISENTWRSVDIAFVYLKPNTKYIIIWDDISFSNTNFVPTGSLISVRLKTDNTQIAGWDSSRNYIITTVPSNTNDVCLRVHASQGTAIINKTTVKGLKVLEYIEGMENWGIPYFEGICDVKSPVIHNVDTIEETDSRKINTTTFTSNDDEIIVLRSLPNGVCDTLNVKTGEYVQIIGEITLDGTKRDDLVYHTVLKDNDGDFIRMIINGCSFYDNNKYGNCDKLPFYHEEKTKDSVEAVFPFAGEKHFYIKIKTSRINGAETMENNSSQLRDAFLNWLAQNPITVQYELATPIVKQVNVEGYPYAYENGHILLESGSQEQSLTPTIEYSIVANRGGQIRSNQRMVERHQKKLDSLYAMTLVNMIDSQYKQVLMKLKSDLGSEVTSWDI